MKINSSHLNKNLLSLKKSLGKILSETGQMIERVSVIMQYRFPFKENSNILLFCKWGNNEWGIMDLMDIKNKNFI